MKRFSGLVGLVTLLISAPAWAQWGAMPSHSGDRVEEWIDSLRWPDSDVREAAAKALGSAGDDRAVRPLMRALKDDSGHVRASAAWSLGELGAVDSADALASMCTQDAYSPARAAAATSLGKLGTGGKALRTALGDRADRVRSAAAEALAAVGGSSAAGDVRGLLGDRAWQVRMSAAASLGAMKSSSSVDALVHSLATDDHEYVRAGAAKALGRIGNDASIPALKSAMNTDGSQRVRKEAAGALIRMRVPLSEEADTDTEPTMQPDTVPPVRGNDVIDL